MHTVDARMSGLGLLVGVLAIGCGPSSPAPTSAPTAGGSPCAIQRETNLTLLRDARGFQLALPGGDWEVDCAPADGAAVVSGSSRELGTVMSVVPFERTDVDGEAAVLQAMLERLQQANAQHGLTLTDVQLAQETVGELSRLVLSYSLQGAAIDQAGACSVHAWSAISTTNGILALHFSFTGERGRCDPDLVRAVRGSTLTFTPS
jgi:hypothetical protein